MTKVVRILMPVAVLSWVASGAVLHLKQREIRTEAGQRVRVEPAGPRWTAGRSHLILQFQGPWNEHKFQELNDRDAYLVGALPDGAVMVSVRDDFSPQGLDLEWAGRLDSRDKVSSLFDHLHTAGATWFVAEFFPDVDMNEARRLAEAAGLQVHEHPDLIATHLLLSGSVERLSGLAQWDEVAYVFPASRALIRGERVRHCAGALTASGLIPMYAVAGTGWPKDASGQVTLGYVFGALTPKLPASQTTQELMRALDAWTGYAPVKFVAGQSGSASKTVWINFFSKDHGDGYPFDGPGGTLAHSFYPAPPNPEPIAGDMHLDADEDWHIGANTDLFTVAVHEAGHVLGLAHVDNPAAVMYPYYRLGAKIAADDIAGLQSLYGAPQNGTAPASPVSALTLSILAPGANSSTTAATTPCNGTVAGGNGSPVQVTWQNDHGASGTASGTSNWNVPSIPLTIGNNTITVTAKNASQAAVQTVSIRRTAGSSLPAPVDHTPPTLTLVSPSSNVVTTRSGTIDLKGSASDAVGVTKVTWQAVAGSGTASGTTNWSVSGIPLVIGDNTLIVRAYDAAGNVAWRSVLVIRN